MEVSKVKNNEFFLPLDIPRKKGFTLPSASIEDIKMRLFWILNLRSKYDVLDDSTSPLALGLFECTMDDPNQRILFHTLRMQREKHHFEQALQDFTELEFTQLFMYNGLEEYMDEAMIKKVETLDLYWFWFRMTRGGQIAHPKHVKPPTVIFRVAMEECPVPNLPLHKYGLVHLTYKELGAWVWQVFTSQFQKLAFRNPQLQEEEDRWLKPLRDLMQTVNLATIPVPKNPTQKDERPKVVPFKGEKAALDLPDMEDLIKIAPPCVANCMKAPRFVYNNEAMKLIPILQEAGVPFETLANWMERKNAAYPHQSVSYKDADARRNYTEIWQKKRGLQFCGNIITDTLANKTNVLTCPFAHSAEPRKMCSPDEKYEFKMPGTLITRRLPKKK